MDAPSRRISSVTALRAGFVGGGGGGGGQAFGLAEPFGEQLLHGAVLVHLGDGGVDGFAGFGVALFEADAVFLVGEGVAEDLEVAAGGGGLGGEAGQDQVVGGDGVQVAALEFGDAFGVVGGADE